jgi:hypothetical protein
MTLRANPNFLANFPGVFMDVICLSRPFSKVGPP